MFRIEIGKVGKGSIASRRRNWQTPGLKILFLLGKAAIRDTNRVPHHVSPIELAHVSSRSGTAKSHAGAGLAGSASGPGRRPGGRGPFRLTGTRGCHTGERLGPARHCPSPARKTARASFPPQVTAAGRVVEYSPTSTKRR